MTTTTTNGVEVIRWGHNLAKPCKKVTGIRPKDFRDRFATQLREHDFNQVNIERLMGHSALDTNSTYGGRNWDRYVQMIESINDSGFLDHLHHLHQLHHFLGFVCRFCF